MQQIEEVNILAKLDILKTKIKESGITITSIAKKSGMSRETLYNRLKGKGEFNASEIVVLTEILHMNKEERDEIFFGEDVAYKTTSRT